MKPKLPPSPDAVRLKMASLCARSEQCESDIRTRIGRTGLSAEQADEIVSFLKREKFLDNARFARAFAGDKLRFSGWGRLKIRLGLVAKKIPATLISDALAGLSEEDYDKALMSAARSKARSLNLNLRTDAIKLYRHLGSRGFESDSAMNALRRLRAELRENDSEQPEGGEA